MSDLYKIYQREYNSFQRLQYNVSAVDRSVESFSCLQDDEYHIEGEMGMPLPPFVAKFSDEILYGNMLGVADEDGHVKLLDTRSIQSSLLIKEWSAHSNAVFDIAWIGGEPKLVTASGDQTARLWDIERLETIAIFRGHTCSLKSVAVQPGSHSVFLTAARDGNIMLWDTRCNTKNGYYHPTNTIHNAHALLQKNVVGKNRKSRKSPGFNADSKTSVTAAVFQDYKTIISSGACDGMLKFWDIRKNYTHSKGDLATFHVIQFPGRGPRKHGYTSLVLNSTLSSLFAVCTNDIIYEYSTTNLSTLPISTFKGIQASSFYVKAALSPDDRYLLCGSSDSHAYIWRTDHTKEQPWVLKGHLGEVTSVTWSPRIGDKVVTCSDDNTFKIWRMLQNTHDATMITGKCERKVVPMEISLKDILSDSELLSREIPTKRNSHYCSPLKICSNQRVNLQYSFHGHASLVCKTPELSRESYTSVTPKQSSQLVTPKPSQRITPKIAPASGLNSPAGRENFPTTPKSSRLFMETWLKSPATSDQMEFNKKSTVFCFDASNDNSHLQMNCKTTLVENKTKRNESKTTPCDDATKVKRKKRDFLSPNVSLDIKSLLTSGKRKRCSQEKENSKLHRLKICDSNERRVKDLLDHAEDST